MMEWILIFALFAMLITSTVLWLANRFYTKRMENLIRDMADNGLVYWAPVTPRGHVQKAMMLARVDVALQRNLHTVDEWMAILNDSTARCWHVAGHVFAYKDEP